MRQHQQITSEDLFWVIPDALVEGNDCCARCSTASSVLCLNSLTQKTNLTKATEWRPWQFRAIQDTHGLILTLMHPALRVPGWDCVQQVHQMGKVRKGFCGSWEHTPSSGNGGGTQNNPVSTQSTQGRTYRSHRPRIGVRKTQREKSHSMATVGAGPWQSPL